MDKAFASVDEAFLVELNKCLCHDLTPRLIHGEVLATPVHAVTHAAHLLGDGFATLFLPFPHFRDEVFSGDLLCGAKRVSGQALLLELPLHDNLCGNACVIGARNPSGIGTRHAVITRQTVHDRLIKGVPHVQSARDIGRWELDGKRRCTMLCDLSAFVACHAITTGLPLGPPMGFDLSGLKRFG